MKKECLKYGAWCVKKGKSLALVCSEVNLALVPKDTTRISVTMQGCLQSRLSNDDERFIFVGDNKSCSGGYRNFITIEN